MEAFRLYQQQRRMKQLLMAVLFVVVIILGWTYPVLGYFIPLCMVAGITIGAYRGRKWCDWYCPRGSFYDSVMCPASPRKTMPPLFRNMVVRIGVMVVLMGIIASFAIQQWPSLSKIGTVFVVMLSVTTVIGVILAFSMHHRSWCMLCPIGTVARVVGRNRQALTIDSHRCVECKLCAKVCPVQIKPYAYKKDMIMVVNDGDCLKCGLCVAVCPKKALT